MYIKDYITRDTTTQLKGIAIILVLLGHLNVIQNAGAWGVGLFLVISGYGLTQSYLKNGLKDFFKKRILNVIIPYSIVTILWIIIDSINGQKYQLNIIITSILGINFKSIIDVTMWYIPFLMIWYVAFFICFKFFKKEYIKVIGLYITSILMYLYFYKLFNNNVGMRLYILSFPIGVMLAFIFSKKINISQDKFKHIIAGIIILSYFIFEISKMRTNISAFYMVSIISSSILFLSIAIILNNIISKVLMFIGSISFEIYLLEGVFINKYRFIFDNIQNIFVSIVVYILFIIIISYLYHKTINRIISIFK